MGSRYLLVKMYHSWEKNYIRANSYIYSISDTIKYKAISEESALVLPYLYIQTSLELAQVSTLYVCERNFMLETYMHDFSLRSALYSLRIEKKNKPDLVVLKRVRKRNPGSILSRDPSSIQVLWKSVR